MQIKMKYHYMLISIAKIQGTDNTKCWWEDNVVVSYKTKYSLTI